MMRVRHILPAFALLALAVLLLALAGPAAAQEAGDPEQGAELYAENCLVCHGPQGEGRAGASLNHVFGGIAPDAALTATISQGVQGTFMPAWHEDQGGPLNGEQIADIVAYIESWGTAVEPVAPAPRPPAETIPPVEEVDGDPNTGYVVFQQNCVACHGEGGEGRIGATLTTAFAAIEPGAVALDTISRGIEGSLMPPFAQEHGGPLTDDEINDVAAYVLSIQQDAAPPPPEVIGRGSALPLLLVALATVVLIVALGVAVQRRGG